MTAYVQVSRTRRARSTYVRAAVRPMFRLLAICRLDRPLASSRNASLLFRMGNLFVAISTPPKRCDDSQRSDHPAMTIISSKDWPRCVEIGGRNELESVAAMPRNAQSGRRRHHFFCEEDRNLVDNPGEELKVVKLPHPPPGTTVTGIDIVIRVRKNPGLEG